MGLLKTALKKINAAPAMRAWATTHFYKMNHPTFDSEMHHYFMTRGDYFRNATMALALKRITAEGISGEMAELGVYKGDTSKILHSLIPLKKLYLFDTFQGFPSTDLENGSEKDERFKDTNVEEVLSNIGDRKNIIIKKGYVPETFDGLEKETFSFVLIDLDLYKPTLASLNFFYSRTTPGGYILIHDYNNVESNFACKRAVDEFMRDKEEKILEIADMSGTVMFRKL